MTISFILLLMTAYRTLASFLGYLMAEGPLTAAVAAVAAVVIGPLPTLGRFLVLPFMRAHTFVKHELLQSSDEGDNEQMAQLTVDGAEGEGGAAPGEATAAGAAAAEPAAGGGSAATGAGSGGAGAPARPANGAGAAGTGTAGAGTAGGEMPKRNLKQRGRPATKAEIEEQREALLRGDAPAGLAAGLGAAGGPSLSTLPLSEVLARKPAGAGRLHAAAAMQFDLLLSTTKYVIPLLALITTGQVFNGLFSSMITAQILHKVPAMRPEMHHALLVLVGLLHTLLCAGKSPLHDLQAPDGGVLQLTWSWSVKDVLAIANVVALGATFSSTAGGGNEPFFSASFAAGIALRMLLYETMPKQAAGALARLLKDRAQIELIGVDEVAVRAGGGVGTCSGGPVRFLLGGVASERGRSAPATLFAKVALLILPALAAAQWALRCVRLVQRMQREKGREKEKKLRTGELLMPVLRWRLLLSTLICLSLFSLVAYFGAFELNAVGSSLGNVLVIALAGCHFESLLSTYDVRGRLRSAVFFVIFMLL